jgi:RecJ-like exonuclease
MKKILIVIFAAVFVLNSCNSNQQNSSNQAVKGKTVSVKGKVAEIERGKDGYTAKIKTGDKTYSAVISSVNLGTSQYKEVKIGDEIEVEGEIHSGGNALTVTVLK